MNSSLPGELLATHREYKLDTEFIAGWLVKNATKCGFKLPDTATPTPSGPRLKGKARKQAREAMKDGTHSANPNCKIKVSDIIMMAKTIANFKSRPSIPPALGRLFGRAINARRGCTEWYEKFGHGDIESNKRHKHFTNVLAEAWDTLRPFQTSNKKRTGPEPKPDADTRKDASLPLRNRFSELHVQETSTDRDDVDEPSQADTSPESKQDASFKLPGITPVAIEKDEGDIEADFFFAIYAFLGDIDKLRGFVEQLWLDYTSGKMELGVVSVLTNIAIHLVRRAEQAFDLCIQRPKKYPASKFPVWSLPALFLYKQHQDDPLFPKMDIHDFVLPSSRITSIECEHTNFCMWPVYNAAKYTVWRLEKDVKTVYNAKDAFSGAPWLLYHYECNKQGGETFKRVREMLPGFQATSVAFENSFAQDEITRGIFEIFRTGTLPVWAVFGIRILLNIQDILQGTPAKQPLEELQLHTQNMLETADLYKRESNPFGKAAKDHTCTKGWAELCLEDMRGLILEDGFRYRVRVMLATYGVSRETITKRNYAQEEYYFLKRNPLRCGILKYCLYFRSHCTGPCFERSWSGLTSLIHVYAACRRLHPDDPVWPDMELFLHNQDVEHLFVGGLPRSTGEAVRKNVLAFGCRGTARPAKGAPKVRKVSDPNRMHDVLKDWLGGGEEAKDFLLRVMAIAYDPKCFKERAQRTDLSAAEADSLIAQWFHARADPVQFLQVLSFYLNSDTDLYFDWHQLHAFAEEIWRDITAVTEQSFECAP
ncbi:hypothetical protein PG997_001387 [Apiospora hydei]|uniref:DUF6604 domain-containing protein n=1 Tax=Apiospora hydei TaxID=1337664 RepID=A0ABR1XDK9_9PEZI